MSKELLSKWKGLLDGREIRCEITHEEEEEAKRDGVVIAYGASDDLLELAGAISDEFGAYNTLILPFDLSGPIKNMCNEDEDCPNWTKPGPDCAKIAVVWNPDDSDASWLITVSKRAYTEFKIMEDGEVYCIGAIFILDE